MKLSSLCAAPCFPSAPAFEVPKPGCGAADLKFGHDGRRDFYAVLLRNHVPEALPRLNPKLAIVGLSPAGKQIAEFLHGYRRTGDYGSASVAGAFAGLAGSIIAMLTGLGLTAKLGLHFPRPDSLAGHPDIFGTSLVACATLDTSGGSDAFDARRSAAASRCITLRLPTELTNPAFGRLSHVVVLGRDAWTALDSLRMADGMSVLGHLRSAGKQVINLPHPSGQNGEFVALASLPASRVPNIDAYVAEKWEEYRQKPPRPGRTKEPEAKYKAKRRAVWQAVQAIRNGTEREISLPLPTHEDSLTARRNP